MASSLDRLGRIVAVGRAQQPRAGQFGDQQRDPRRLRAGPGSRPTTPALASSSATTRSCTSAFCRRSTTARWKPKLPTASRTSSSRPWARSAPPLALQRAGDHREVGRQGRQVRGRPADLGGPLAAGRGRGSPRAWRPAGRSSRPGPAGRARHHAVGWGHGRRSPAPGLRSGRRGELVGQRKFGAQGVQLCAAASRSPPRPAGLGRSPGSGRRRRDCRRGRRRPRSRPGNRPAAAPHAEQPRQPPLQRRELGQKGQARRSRPHCRSRR